MPSAALAPPTWILPALLAAAATPLLALLARALGIGDDAARARERKHQREPVPPVGGAALLGALALARLLGGASPCTTPWGSALGPGEPAAWLALLAAFAVGTVDDLRARGLSPLAKLGGQAVVALLAVLALARAPDAPAPLALAFLAFALVVAQNVANTFDHADGLLAGLACLGLAPLAPASAGAAAGFLPWNVLARRASGEPVAYLGDAGSHLLALLLVLSPWGWLALAPAAFDLVRVVRERARAGVPPWRGDRRHLGQRAHAALAASAPGAPGSSAAPEGAPLATAPTPRRSRSLALTALLACLLPVLPIAIGLALGGALARGASVLASLALYAALVRGLERRDRSGPERAAACSARSRSR